MDHVDQEEKEEANTEADLERFKERKALHPDKSEGVVVVPGLSAAPAPALPEESFFKTIEALTAQGADPDTVEKFMKMQERILDRDAKQAFNHSMTRAQNRIDLVVADSYSTQTKSKYATLKKILIDIKPIYTAEGFSLMFYELETSRDNQKKIGVDIIHRQGHVEKRFGYFTIQTTGIAGKAMMTQIHGEGSAIQYGRRYLTCMIFNVPVGEDDDGAAAGGPIVEFINEKQLSEFVDTINYLDADEPVYLEYLGKVLGREIKDLKQIPAKDFKRAMDELKKRKKPE